VFHKILIDGTVLQAKSAQPLDLLLQDDEFPETVRLIKTSGLQRLNQIADQKGLFDPLILDEALFPV